MLHRSRVLLEGHFAHNHVLEKVGYDNKFAERFRAPRYERVPTEAARTPAVQAVFG